MKPTRKRTRAREIAIQALYQFDALRRIDQQQDQTEIQRFIEGETSEPEVREFAQGLIAGTWESIGEIDALLEQIVDNWKIGRIAAMDLAILRLAAYEIRARPDVPPKVSINEAIDLAKRYSTAQSGAFVNGILDKLLRMREPEAGG